MLGTVWQYALELDEPSVVVEGDTVQALTQRGLGNRFDDHGAACVEVLRDGRLKDEPGSSLSTGQPPVGESPRDRLSQAPRATGRGTDARGVAGRDRCSQARCQRVYQHRLSHARQPRD